MQPTSMAQWLIQARPGYVGQAKPGLAWPGVARPCLAWPGLASVAQIQYIKLLRYLAKKMRLDESFRMHRSKASEWPFLSIKGLFRLCRGGGLGQGNKVETAICTTRMLTSCLQFSCPPVKTGELQKRHDFLHESIEYWSLSWVIAINLSTYSL